MCVRSVVTLKVDVEHVCCVSLPLTFTAEQHECMVVAAFELCVMVMICTSNESETKICSC